MTRQSTSDTALAVDPPQMDLDRTSAADAPLIDLRGSTVCLPGPRARLAGGWSWPSWVTRSIDLHEQERDCGMRNTWIAVAAAVGVGILNGGQVWFYRNESTFGSRVAVHALVALMLTPLVVGVYLALPDLARRLLRRLRDSSGRAGERWSGAAADGDHRPPAIIKVTIYGWSTRALQT